MFSLNSYHQLHKLVSPLGNYCSKIGLPFHPYLHPATELFLKANLQAKHLIDATESLGLLEAKLLAKQVTTLTTSKAFWYCAEKACENLQTKAIWQMGNEIADKVCLIPSTSKGNLRTEKEIKGAYNSLIKSGMAYLAMHKDLGAKRYEKLAYNIFGDGEVIAKDKGWRLLRCLKQKSTFIDTKPVYFEALGLNLQAEAGVFSAGKIDEGTALLLDSLDLSDYLGKAVLDLGCGYGLISLVGARAKAKVTAIDDDILAINSTKQNAQAYKLDINTLHSDVNSALDKELFDVVLMNPPFHIGKKNVLDVPRAFFAATQKHLKPQGVLTLVANKDLPYEKELGHWQNVQVLNVNRSFKVISACSS